jgi:hypothetical protein
MWDGSVRMWAVGNFLLANSATCSPSIADFLLPLAISKVLPSPYRAAVHPTLEFVRKLEREIPIAPLPS